MSSTISNKFTKQSGYSAEKANMIIDPDKPVYLLNSQLEKFYRYEDNKRTDQIDHYKAWFSVEGMPPFRVKFLTEITLPKYLSIIEFEGLEAVEVQYNIYFRAKNIKVNK